MKQFMIGNAHVDIVWFWSWQEGYQEVKATFRSALDRMNETAEFIFTCACADYYRWVEENDPEMFEEIVKRVHEGRWVIVGGTWIQPDMNTPSGESLVRHLLYSQRYFMEKFGTIATVGYNVDSFGHNAMVPQLYHKAGMDAYVWMRPSLGENPNIPRGGMLWESPDGTRIRAYRIEGEYTCREHLDEKINNMFAFSAEINQPVLNMYGVGNHGGGPTIANLKVIKDYQANEERGKDIIFASPKDYFAELEKENISLPVWKTELQHHASGCYSTHSRSKHLHRKTENALLRQEKLGVLSAVLTNHQVKKDFIVQAWHNLMMAEFHDSMGGCSAENVLEDILVTLNEACSIAAREENAALQKMSWRVDTMKGLDLCRSKDEDWSLWGRQGQGTPVVVFNPHEFEAEDTLQLCRPIRKVLDDNGNNIPVQIIRANRTNFDDKWDAVFSVKVPAMGYRLYWVYLEESEVQTESPVTATEYRLENAHICAEFDAATGALIHLIDKKSGLDTMKEASSIRVMDIAHCDIWAHNVNTFDKEIGVFELKDMKVIENGPVRAAILVKLQHGQSMIEQRYTLHADSDQLEVKVTADVHEQLRMIKICLPTIFADGKDIAEIPYGMLTRFATGEEEHCQRWCGVQGENGGLVMLNDGRYSYSVKDGELRMTIANTSIFADHFGQNHRDDFCRHSDQGELRFSYVLRPYADSWQKETLYKRAALLHQPLPFVVETYHKGDLKPEFCGIQLDNAAVAAPVLKRAEDDLGYVIRFQETTGAAQKLHAEIPLVKRSMDLTFIPWEIKTMYIPDDANIAPYEIKLTELN